MNKKVKEILVLVINISLLVGLFACIICDLAISRGFTWSLYPIVSIIFLWLIIVPFLYKKQSILSMFISFSIFLIPYIFCLERISQINWFLTIGLPNAIILIAYLWIIYYVFTIKKLRWFYSTAIALSISIPFGILVNIILSFTIDESIIDIWDGLSYGIIIVVSLILFYIGYHNKKSLKNKEK